MFVLADFYCTFFRLSASDFLLLAPQKVTKEEGTQPSRPSAPLRCSMKWAAIETRPDKPHNSWLVAELKQPMADTSHFISATQRDGMGLIAPKPHCINVDDSKTKLCSFT